MEGGHPPYEVRTGSAFTRSWLIECTDQIDTTCTACEAHDTIQHDFLECPECHNEGTALLEGPRCSDKICTGNSTEFRHTPSIFLECLGWPHRGKPAPVTPSGVGCFYSYLPSGGRPLVKELLWNAPASPAEFANNMWHTFSDNSSNSK